MRTISVMLLGGLISSLAVAQPTTPPAQGKGTINVSLVLQDFNWQEDLTDGTSLEESGIIPGLAIDGHSALESDLALHYRAQLFAGTVDYDGYIISLDGTKEPYKSDTRYYGINGDFDASLNIADSQEMQVRPFGGIGSRFWLRELDYGGQFGYDEYWLTIYMRMGCRFQYIGHTGNRWYALAALKLPVYNYEWVFNIPFAPDEEVELKPKKKTGYQLEAGMSHGRLVIAVFYEALNFGKSDPDKTNTFFQPASEMRLAGIRAGISF